MTPLASLLQGLDHQPSRSLEGVAVSGMTADSRAVRPGDLFVALKGARHDGHDHAAEAVRAGAAALLVERDVPVEAPTARVPSTAAALSPVAARFFDHPSRSMDVVGITGTNGKTTITYLLERLWTAAGIPAGVIGTIDYRWPGRVEKAPNTTPQALDLQRILAAMRDAGVKRVAMEVSSHALALGRAEDVEFSVGVFTNLTQDHLDFHKTMDGYFQAKARLFDLLDRSPRSVKRAIINADDPWGRRFLEGARAPAWTYAIAAPADFRAEDLRLSADGSRFRLATPAGSREVHLVLVGRHNVYNALAAFGAGLALGADLDEAAQALASLAGVPGRLERVAPDGPPLPYSVFVDFAHTEDALQNVIATLRPLTRGRLIALFGCGGDRDRGKRPRMGETAARLADHVVITSDNPRSEDPAAILREVAAGAARARASAWDEVVDREEAIARALDLARPGDVVLLAGKGHETSQIFADRSMDFDDRAVARRLMAARQ